jgi:hypothetical protein
LARVGGGGEEQWAGHRSQRERGTRAPVEAGSNTPTGTRLSVAKHKAEWRLGCVCQVNIRSAKEDILTQSLTDKNKNLRDLQVRTSVQARIL